MNDLISVIIPVKNGSNYLPQAISGILKQGMNVEIIVVDDASSDSTAEIAQKYNCKLIRHDISKGPVVAKNSGLKVAGGKYIMFHDHDDIMKDNALKKLYEELSSDSDCFAVEAKVKDFYSPDMPECEKNKTKIKPEAYWGLFTGAILIKKEAFDKIGLFDENVSAGEIISWQAKMDANGLKIKKLDFVSTDRRIHQNNFGKKNKNTEFKDYAAILRAKISGKLTNKI